MIYSSKNDYIGQVIEPALGEYAAGHDTEALADDMLNWHNEVNDKGQTNLGKSGFLVDEEKDFWQVVEDNAW